MGIPTYYNTTLHGSLVLLEGLILLTALFRTLDPRGFCAIL